MREWNFGSLDRRKLTVRIFLPLTWRWEPLAIFGDRCENGSHRCYCDTGRMVDGGVSLCGFAIAWWYSQFWGCVPCVCDTVIEKWLSEKRFVNSARLPENGIAGMSADRDRDSRD